MNSRIMLKLSLSALALGSVVTTGITPNGFSLSALAAPGPNAKKAESEAKAARKAIAKRKGDLAVQHAEAAVANDPTNGDYRAMLGQAYLLAGRFASANQALNDALLLNPADGRVALNLVLAKVAGGDWAGARETLQANADQIPASDRGLALALAGDPVAGVEILAPAARDATATAKTRQNLALSLALAGRWREASEIAAMDVAPDQLQARLMEWAAFARPTNAYDQVASLLGVRAVVDAGQPAALALAQQPNVAVAAAAPVAASDTVDQFMPGSADRAAAPAPVAAVAEASAEPQPEVQQVAGTGPQVVFGPRAEIAQRVPATAARAAAAPVQPKALAASGRTAVLPKAKPTRVAEAKAVPAKLARGSYFVQLGAYDNAAVAHDAWARHTRRFPALASNVPQGAKVSTRLGNFYRLSVGGFARNDADALCRQVKASGSPCFVRPQARDAVAAWVKSDGPQVASR